MLPVDKFFARRSIPSGYCSAFLKGIIVVLTSTERQAVLQRTRKQTHTPCTSRRLLAMGRLLRKKHESVLALRYLASIENDNDTSPSKRSTTATTASSGTTPSRRSSLPANNSMDTSENSSLTSRKTPESGPVGRSFQQSLEYVTNWDPCRVDTTATSTQIPAVDLKRTTSALSGASTEIATNRAVDIAHQRMARLQEEDELGGVNAENVNAFSPENTAAPPIPRPHVSSLPARRMGKMPSLATTKRLVFGTPRISARRLESTSILSLSSNESSRLSSRASPAGSQGSKRYRFHKGKLSKYVIRQARKNGTGPVDCDASFPSRNTDTETNEESMASSIGVQIASPHFLQAQAMLQAQRAACGSPAKSRASQDTDDGMIGVVGPNELSRITESAGLSPRRDHSGIQHVTIFANTVESPKSTQVSEASADPVFCPTSATSGEEEESVDIDRVLEATFDSSSDEESSKLDHIVERTFNDELEATNSGSQERGDLNSYSHRIRPSTVPRPDGNPALMNLRPVSAGPDALSPSVKMLASRLSPRSPLRNVVSPKTVPSKPATESHRWQSKTPQNMPESAKMVGRKTPKAALAFLSAVSKQRVGGEHSPTARQRRDVSAPTPIKPSIDRLSSKMESNPNNWVVAGNDDHASVDLQSHHSAFESIPSPVKAESHVGVREAKTFFEVEGLDKLRSKSAPHDRQDVISPQSSKVQQPSITMRDKIEKFGNSSGFVSPGKMMLRRSPTCDPSESNTEKNTFGEGDHCRAKSPKVASKFSTQHIQPVVAASLVQRPVMTSVQDRVMQFSNMSRPPVANARTRRPIPITARSLLRAQAKKNSMTIGSGKGTGSLTEKLEEDSYIASSPDRSSEEHTNCDDSEYTDGVTLDMSIADVSILTLPTAIASKADGDSISAGEVSPANSSPTLREPSEAGSLPVTEPSDPIEGFAKRSEASSSQPSEAAAPLIARSMRMRPMSDEMSTGDSFFAARALVAKHWGSSQAVDQEGSIPADGSRLVGAKEAALASGEGIEEKKEIDERPSNGSDKASGAGGWDTSRLDGVFPAKQSKTDELFDFDSEWQPFENEAERAYFLNLEKKTRNLDKEFERKLLDVGSRGDGISLGTTSSKTPPTRNTKARRAIGPSEYDGLTFRERAVQAALEANNVPLQEYQDHAYYYESRRTVYDGESSPRGPRVTPISPPTFNEVFGRTNPRYRDAIPDDLSPVNGETVEPQRLFVEDKVRPQYPRSDPGGHSGLLYGGRGMESLRKHPDRYFPRPKSPGVSTPPPVSSPPRSDNGNVKYSHLSPISRGTSSNEGRPERQNSVSPSQHGLPDQVRARLQSLKKSRMRRSVTPTSTNGNYNMPNGFQLASDRYRSQEADEYSSSTISSTRFGGHTFLSALDVD